ncbi:MAG TPA: cell division protein ZipA [Pseudomonadales bacterium]
MDIKDFILIGGGLLIVAVVAHGLWIAWKARRDPLRMDLVTQFADADDDDDLKRLRAELPNGGARIVARADAPAQGRLELERGAIEPRPGRAAAGANVRKTEPRLEPLPERPGTAERHGHTDESVRAAAAAPEPADEPAPGTAAPAPRAPERRADAGPAAPRRGKVKDVTLPEPRGAGRKRGSASAAAEPRKAERPVEELIVLNVLAPKGKPFTGPGVVEALRARGLRYGQMNIFHRIDPLTRGTLYSVANVVEPGTFDLSDLERFRSPGICFFMQLPGPEQPLEVFEDMLKAARDVAVRVGGEVKDEQRSVMTGQTVEHYRQRITDFCRRRMSMRA